MIQVKVAAIDDPRLPEAPEFRPRQTKKTENQ
jgi:hypothetical protein